MIRIAACALVLASCFESHDPNSQAVAQQDCYTCHVPEYQATGTSAYPLAPPHEIAQCGTQCAECHTTATWHNGLGNDPTACMHPEDKFPLASQGTLHANVKCVQCHSTAIADATGATSAGGANTDCTACHPNVSVLQDGHVGVTYKAGALTGQPYNYSNTDHRFCLDCHPTGLPPRHSPGNPFVLPHHGSHCVRCHDPASNLGHANGADVLCVNSGCHGGAHNQKADNHGNCWMCHRTGGGGDGG